MPQVDFTSTRLFVEAPLASGQAIKLDKDQANYLVNVLRMGPGSGLLVFNGRDGEWQARLTEAGKRNCVLVPLDRLRPQPPQSELWYCFAPPKAARLDYIVQKAVEMGAGRIVPVMTQHTQVARLNIARLAANAREAAEQCGVLNIPDVAEETRFDKFLAALPPERWLIFCDEAAETHDPLLALDAAKDAPLALIIGPEGGFSQSERKALIARANIVRLSLGPRILRADTAGVAALALIQARLGDWR